MEKPKSNNDCNGEDIRKQRTSSMVSLPGNQKQLMSTRYKYVHAVILWFCYFSLALDDYIFGPTFNDLISLLSVNFETIAYFTIIRQVSYTCGSFGGVAFDYVNRQISLVVLMFLSGLVLMATPFVPSVPMFYLIGALNGAASGACDCGFHVWIMEMFQNAGGPLVQGLHTCFGIGIALAPLIAANFLSAESECSKHTGGSSNATRSMVMLHAASQTEINDRRFRLFIPYTVVAVFMYLGGTALLVLFFYKRYIPPQERNLPKAFEDSMPATIEEEQKEKLWRNSLPSFYKATMVFLGALMLGSYFGLEVTYFDYISSFATAAPLVIEGTQSAMLASATGGVYSLGGFIATCVSIYVSPEHMIYANFALINIANFILLVHGFDSLTMLWLGNLIMGLGFSSTFATAYTFMEHQVAITNVIGAIFLFATGVSMSIFPLFLTNICQEPMNLVYCTLVACNLALLVFGGMHLLHRLRCRSVQLLAAGEFDKTSESERDQANHRHKCITSISGEWSYCSSDDLSLTYYRNRSNSALFNS